MSSADLEGEVDGLLVQPHGGVDVHARLVLLLLRAQAQRVLQVVAHLVRVLGEENIVLVPFVVLFIIVKWRLPHGGVDVHTQVLPVIALLGLEGKEDNDFHLLDLQ